MLPQAPTVPLLVLALLCIVLLTPTWAVLPSKDRQACIRYQATSTAVPPSIDKISRYTEAAMEDGEYWRVGSYQYEWMTSQIERQNGISMIGSPNRLRNALNRFHSCESNVLTVGFVGGAPTHASREGAATGFGYPRWVELILRQSLVPDREDIQRRLRFFDTNGPLNSTSTSTMAPPSPHFCHHAHLPQNTDIVFVDDAASWRMMKTCTEAESDMNLQYIQDLNLWVPLDLHADRPEELKPRRKLEHLLRSLLDLPNHPAVILVNSFVWAAPFSTTSQQPNFVSVSCERDLSEFASFYDLTMLSLKAALWQRVIHNETGFKPAFMHSTTYTTSAPGSQRYMDDIHDFLFFNESQPGELVGATAGRMLGELAAQVVLDAAASLLSAPFNPKIELEKVNAPLSRWRMLVGGPGHSLNFTDKCESHFRYHKQLTAQQHGGVLGEGCADSSPPSPPWLLNGSTALNPTCIAHSLDMKPKWESVLSRGTNPALSPNLNPGVQTFTRHNYTSSTFHKGDQADKPYVWWTPDDDRIAGLTYQGNQARLRAAVQRYMSGGNMTAVFFGGSVTAGAGRQESLTYPEWSEVIVRKLLGDDPDQPRVRFINAGIRATTSALMASCHGVYAPADTDIFFLEYSHNDIVFSPGNPDAVLRRAYERLVRKLLRYKNKPAVIVYHHYNYLQAGPRFPDDKQSSNQVVHDLLSTGKSDLAESVAMHREGGYVNTNTERDYQETAWYYNLPSISVKAAFFHLMRNELDGFWVWRPRSLEDPYTPGMEQHDEIQSLVGHSFYNDLGHPEGHTGYRAMGELAAQLVLNAAASVMEADLSLEEIATIESALPEPMLAQNYESTTNVCIVNEDLRARALSVESHGWEWSDEGRGKWGWISTEPGSVLRIMFSSMGGMSTEVAGTGVEGAEASPVANHNKTVKVSLAHLVSYQHMGKASVVCRSGCVCSPFEIDGHTEGHFSQLVLKDFHVSMDPHCVIEVVVLQDTSSPQGDHKVKVGGVMVEEDLLADQYLESFQAAFAACIPGADAGCYGAD